MKKTVPKQPRDLVVEEDLSNDSDTELTFLHTPPDTPPSEKRLKAIKHHELETPTFENGLPEFCSNESELYYSYRRFSARKRKQTNFLGVGGEQRNEVRGRRRRSGRNSTSRTLVFPVESEETQAKECGDLSPSVGFPATEEEAATEVLISLWL